MIVLRWAAFIVGAAVITALYMLIASHFRHKIEETTHARLEARTEDVIASCNDDIDCLYHLSWPGAVHDNDSLRINGGSLPSYFYLHRDPEEQYQNPNGEDW